jgi:hypothetical protein
VRGEVFEVTWFKEGTRKRKLFRDAIHALKHAEDTAKALDSGKGDSLALSGAELESYRLAKRILAEIDALIPLLKNLISSRFLLCATRRRHCPNSEGLPVR